MAEFRTNKEQKKWQALEAGSQGSLNRVLSGKATQSDYRKVSDTLSKYDQLAGRIFKQGIDAMEEAADNLLKKIEKDREAKGKEPLTEEQITKLFDLAFDRQIKDFGPDLVETIDSMLDKKLEASDERVERTFTSQFSKLSSIVKSPEEQREILADLFTPKEKELDEEAEQQAAFLDKIEDRLKVVLKETLKDVLNQDKHRGVPSEKRTNPFSMVRSLFGRAKAGATAIKGAAATGIAGITKLLPTLSPRGENAVVENSQKQASFTQLLSEKLGSIFDWVKKRASSQGEREDQQENRWLRKLKLGGFAQKAWGNTKDMASRAKGWLPLLGKGLAAAILAPGLIKTITSTLGQWFTWDNIKSTLGNWWDTISAQGSTVMNWVIDKVTKIDYKGIAKSLWDSFVGLFTTPKKEEPPAKTAAGRAVQQGKKADFGGALLSAGGDMAVSPDMVAAYDPNFNKTEPVKSAPQKVLKAAPSKPVTSTGVTTPATLGGLGGSLPSAPQKAPLGGKAPQYDFTVAAPAGNNRAGVGATLNQSNAFNFTIGDRTRSQPFNQVQFKPGVAMEDPLVNIAKAANKQREMDKGFYQNRTTIGLGSVPLLSGVSPTLGLLNLGVAG